MLDNPSGALLDDILAELELASKELPALDDSNRYCFRIVNIENQKVLMLQNNDRDIHVRFHTEKGLVHHYYAQDSLSKDEFVQAQECSGFTWSVSGALGRRTKFQSFDVSQLVVKAKSLATTDVSGTDGQGTPRTLELEDDVLLNKIKFTDEETSEDQELKGSLNPRDQCLLLAFW